MQRAQCTSVRVIQWLRSTCVSTAPSSGAKKLGQPLPDSYLVPLSNSGAPHPGSVRFEAPLEILQPTGSRTYATFRLGSVPVMAELDAHDGGRHGDTVTLEINLNRASLFDAETQRAL